MSEEGKIIKVVDIEDGNSFSINMDNGYCFGLDKKYGYIPQAGDYIIQHIINGSVIRGITANGKVIFYKSDEQLEREHLEWQANYEKEKQETFLKEKLQLDSDYNNLPDVFKKRIDRFRTNNPRFRVDFESYEMFCCKEAVKIAEHCKTFEAVAEFKNKDFELHKQAGLSDQHSGNTFGTAFYLAYWYLKQPEAVYKIHGSLSVLVGSEKYGDIPIEEQSEKEN